MLSYYKNLSAKNKKIIWIIIIVFLFLFLSNAIIRIYSAWKLRINTDKYSTRTVHVMKAVPGPHTLEIILPANVIAWHQATIYARINGYVSQWYVDFGSAVKQGDLLALISAPEVDSQLRQTEADLKTAEANYLLAKITADRWVKLLKTDSVSKQETDEKVSDREAKAAIVASTKANRDRLRDLVT